MTNKELTLVLMCRLLSYFFDMIFFRISRAKRSLYVSGLQVSFVFMYTSILLGDMLMCLICVINNFHCLWYMYSHIARQMKIQSKKIKSNLSANRSTLKSCNSKTSPVTPDKACINSIDARIQSIIEQYVDLFNSIDARFN